MFWKVFVFAVFGFIAGIDAHCTPCLEAPTHYGELNCTGAKNAGDCCDTRYICPDAVFDKLPDKCQYHGQLYSYGEKVDESLLPQCVLEAKCVASLDGPKFELLRVSPKVHRFDCLAQFTLEKTCYPSKQVCDDAEKEALPKCYANGNEYHEGELFTPNFGSYFSSACYRCRCDANFDNTTVPANNFNCRKLPCAIELENIDKLRNGCVPVYASRSASDYEPSTCCPIDYECPNSNPKETYRPSASTAPRTCVFGDKTFSDDRPVEMGQKCRTCSCKTPPALTCIQAETC